MNDALLNLEVVAPWFMRKVRRVPGAVTGLWYRGTRAGGLMFAWQCPSGATPLDGYRTARTREGREYEWVAETTAESFVLPPVALNDGWFYRVTAFNERGEGPARWVYFFLRRRRDPILQLVPVRPGLRVTISELLHP
jgi:hypothetical protein